MIKDNEKVYDEQIAPLMNQIIKICQENKIPTFATFVYNEDTELGPLMCTTSLPFEVKELEIIAGYIYKEGTEV